MEVKCVSGERTITERLARLEEQQGNIQGSMGKLEGAMTDLVRSVNSFVATQGKVDARLLAIEQDLRDGRDRFKIHDSRIANIEKRCDESKWIRDAGARHLEEAKGQEVSIQGAVLTAGWAERAVWLLVTAVLGFLASR
jgi:chromosome segregation ATPase